MSNNLSEEELEMIYKDFSLLFEGIVDDEKEQFANVIYNKLGSVRLAVANMRARRAMEGIAEQYLRIIRATVKAWRKGKK